MAVLVSAVALVVGAAPAAAASDLLPNLVADPPANAELDVNMGHLLLRFDGFVHNAGPGPLEVRGQRATTADPMVAYQRIYRTDGTTYDVAMPGAQFVYAANDGHQHWHLQNVAAYSLWNYAKTQPVAPADKVGFCMADSEHVDPFGPTTPYYSDSPAPGVPSRAFCEKNNPDALSVFEGISSGWRDVYEKTLVFQWVDVTDVAPGVYWLREDVDPKGFVREASPDRRPAYATTASTIPGYDARPLALGVIPTDAPTPITLTADHYGQTGAVQFRVDTPPAHGTLSVASGALFTDPHITYQPNPGYRGPDSFTYVAQDDASSYPHHPAQATVSLNVGPLPPRVVAPANASPPTITGTVEAGRKLSASTGSWTGTQPLSYRYQWQRCHPACANVPGATSSSYTPRAAEIGARVKVVVTASNPAGSESAASPELGPVRSVPPTRAANKDLARVPSDAAREAGDDRSVVEVRPLRGCLQGVDGRTAADLLVAGSDAPAFGTTRAQASPRGYRPDDVLRRRHGPDHRQAHRRGQETAQTCPEAPAHRARQLHATRWAGDQRRPSHHTASLGLAVAGPAPEAARQCNPRRGANRLG